jgi:hypothetical protein
MHAAASTADRSVPVSRNELAVAVAGAFGAGAVHRDAIAARARAAGARFEVIQLLYRAPAYRYQTLDQLLTALAGAGLGRP